MKKILVVAGIVTSMVVGFAAMASAAVEYDSNWVINLKFAQASDGTGGGTLVLGTRGTYSDGFGSEDKALSPGPIGAYGYTSIEGMPEQYVQDQRGSFTGKTMVWDITLAGGSTYAGGPIYVFGWNPKNTTTPVNNPNNDFAPLGNETIKLWQVNADSTRTLLWDVNSAVNGTGTAADANTYKGMFASGAGTKLQLEVQAVPEPGSMLAMLSGLVGLAGFGIRRRK